MVIADTIRHVRNLGGVLTKDLLRYRRALRVSEPAYLGICNRDERLEAARDGQGYRCLWQWTSDLHAPKYLPALGLSLMRRALADHPFVFAALPQEPTDSPDVSFIIGHRSVERLPQLLTTIGQVAGQRNATVECIVVEQDAKVRIAGRLPSWVRHLHTPPPATDMPYCRSWAFNVGVGQARGAVVVLHDNDMVVPADYATNIMKHVRQGHEVVNLKRFIFCLSKKHSRAVVANKAKLTDKAPVSVMQNAEGGGSIAITRTAYEQIGGFDESFVGWGGEDNEFWERAQTLRVWPYAYLPIVHLWHAPQAGKNKRDNPTLNRYQTMAGIPAPVRIAELRKQRAGDLAGPAGWTPSSGVR